MHKLLICMSLAILTSPVFAADAVVDEVVDLPPVFSWTGGYVGLQGGYAWGDGHIQGDDGTYADPEPDGFIGGIYAGYNYQLPSNIVVGFEADVTYSNLDGSALAFDPSGALIGGGAEQELNWSGAGRLRLGYAMDRFLPYVAGGVAFGDIDTTIFDDGGDTTNEFDDTYVGWTIGAGLEYAVTDNLVVRGEYRFTDFGSETFEFDGGDDAEIDLETNEVRFGLAWKF